MCLSNCLVGDEALDVFVGQCCLGYRVDICVHGHRDSASQLSVYLHDDLDHRLQQAALVRFPRRRVLAMNRPGEAKGESLECSARDLVTHALLHLDSGGDEAVNPLAASALA